MGAKQLARAKIEQIGRRIAALRDLQGMNQEQFVQALGSSDFGRSALSKVEIGLQAASVELINALAERFGVRRDWLLAGEAPIYQDGTPLPDELDEAVSLLAHLSPETRAAVLLLIRQLAEKELTAKE